LGCGCAFAGGRRIVAGVGGGCDLEEHRDGRVACAARGEERGWGNRC
jgi:hypothetical protein